MIDLRCLVGLHDYERVGQIAPIKKVTDWSNYYIGHYAMGKCRRCGKLEMRRHYAPGQTRSWKGLYEETFESYIEEHKNEWLEK